MGKAMEAMKGMETRPEKAVRLFKEGYNCSQSVFMAYSEEYGIDRETASRLAASFGAGMGRMREVCGAVSGMLLVAGLETGAVEGNDREGKKKNYQTVQELAAEYRKKNGSIICRELLGLRKDAPIQAEPEKRTEEYYKKRPCPELIRQAAEILEQAFFSEEAKAEEIKGAKEEAKGG